jgi:hypothetical protein
MDEIDPLDDFEEKPPERAPGNYRIPLIEHDIDSVPVQEIRFDADGTRWHVGAAPKLKSTVQSMMAMGAFTGGKATSRASIGTIKRAEDINRQIAHNYVHSGKIKFQFARRKGSSIVAACAPVETGFVPRIGAVPLSPINRGGPFGSTWQQRNAMAQMSHRTTGMIPSFSAPASLSSTLEPQKIKRKKLLPYAVQTQKDWDNYLEKQVRELPAAIKF